jgi:cell division septation protein DedD
MQVELERTDDGHFEGVAEAPRSGTYAVSGVVTDNDGETMLSSSTLASNSYPAEYVPGALDVAFMTRLADSTNGRTDVTTANVWDSSGLSAGSRVVELLPILLLVACLLWPIAVVLSRISVRGATVAGARQGVTNVGRSVRDLFPKIGGKDPEIGTARRPTPTTIAEPASTDVTTNGETPAAARSAGPAMPAKPAPPATPAATAVVDKPAPTPGASSLSDLLAKKRERRTPKSD